MALPDGVTKRSQQAQEEKTRILQSPQYQRAKEYLDYLLETQDSTGVVKLQLVDQKAKKTALTTAKAMLGGENPLTVVLEKINDKEFEFKPLEAAIYSLEVPENWVRPARPPQAAEDPTQKVEIIPL